MTFVTLFSSANAATRKLIVHNGSGSGTYQKYSNVSISADPAPPNKIFYRWNGTQTARLADRYSPNTTYNIKRNAHLTATYINIPKYNLTVSSGSGDGSYYANTIVSISADPPAEGKAFAAWTGSMSQNISDSSAASTTFTMPAQNTTLTATYADLPKLTVVNGAGSGYYSENTSVNVIANPPEHGKLFDRWDGSKINNLGDRYASTTTFNMPAEDSTLTAVYKDDPNADDSGDGLQNEYSLVSVGVFGDQTRTVLIENIRKKTWAQYALWSNNNRDIYFIGGEKFHGAVHANTPLYFYSNPEFFGKLTSASSYYGGSTNNCIFHQGFKYPVAPESLADVDFDSLKSKAFQTLEGVTYVTLAGTNLIVSNSRKGWNNKKLDIPKNGLMYIDTATTGSSSSRPGDLYIQGMLDGRLTFATERDINITGHITYASDPQTNAASDDALGLISMRDVVVKPSCPNNLKIFAHILATGKATSTSSDGSFGVENYNKGSKRGYIYLHGGIAQDYRGAVGTFSRNGGSGTGYSKHYTYDTRFMNNPPPEYPPLTNKLIPGLWRDH